MKRLPIIGGGRHFARGELLLALGSGLDEAGRRRALRHFGGACRVCWGRLEELKDAPLRLDGSCDFVARALARSLLALRGVWEPPPMTSPIHLYWVSRVARDPAVFPRLVIEEAQLLWVEGSPEGLSAPEEAVKLLAVPRRPVLGRARRHDLAALAHLYLAYPAYRRELLRVEALHHVYLAGEHRRRGSGDPEVRALELMMGAWVGGPGNGRRGVAGAFSRRGRALRRGSRPSRDRGEAGQAARAGAGTMTGHAPFCYTDASMTHQPPPAMISLGCCR